MGECGCGDFHPYESYRLGDYVLAIEIYKGCSYCNTGLMVGLHLFTDAEARRYDIEAHKEFKPDEYGHSQIDLPLIGKDDLVKAAQKLEPEFSEYGDLMNFLSDYGLELLQNAINNRLEELRQQNR